MYTGNIQLILHAECQAFCLCSKKIVFQLLHVKEQ